MQPTEIIIRNVRLAFPDVFKAVQFEGAGPFSYKSTLLVDPGTENDKAIRQAINQAATSKWAAKAGEYLKALQASGSSKFCYVDGITKAYDGFAGKWALSASRPQDSGPVKLINRDMSPLDELSGKPYAGCYVNAKVQLWAQDNNFGKGIRCTLIALQFVGDGESFGGTPPATTEGMEAIEAEASEGLI